MCIAIGNHVDCFKLKFELVIRDKQKKILNSLLHLFYSRASKEVFKRKNFGEHKGFSLKVVKSKLL